MKSAENRRPQPEILGRNGTYVVFRKFWSISDFTFQDEFEFFPEHDEELLAGDGPLACAAARVVPISHDNPQLSSPQRSNTLFLRKMTTTISSVHAFTVQYGVRHLNTRHHSAWPCSKTGCRLLVFSYRTACSKTTALEIAKYGRHRW